VCVCVRVRVCEFNMSKRVCACLTHCVWVVCEYTCVCACEHLLVGLLLVPVLLISRPQREIVSQKLHNQRTVLIRIFGE